MLSAVVVTDPATGFALTYGPLAAGRTYRPLVCTNLANAQWSALATYLGPTTNAGKATIIDPNPGTAAKFYRLGISYP
jgi:hypothetical protein